MKCGRSVTIRNPSQTLRSAMIETNPIRSRITDLRERLSSLRGYL